MLRGSQRGGEGCQGSRGGRSSTEHEICDGNPGRITVYLVLGQFTLPVQQNQERPTSRSNFKFEYTRMFILLDSSPSLSNKTKCLDLISVYLVLGQFTLPVQQNQERPTSLSNFKFEYTRLFILLDSSPSLSNVH